MDHGAAAPSTAGWGSGGGIFRPPRVPSRGRSGGTMHGLAVITPSMKTRHDDDVQALRDDPQLCTTHSVIIIDQSGSMKKSDVNGFRNRSKMAYGVLALDYIAEQLHAQGRDDDSIIDIVTIIEMNDSGTIVIDREPLDWILFNKVLERKDTAKPRSHGNYNDSLLIAKELIDQEISQAGGCSSLDDMPSYALILLSDGKPSDCLPWHSAARISIISTILASLSTKLMFRAIGLGAFGADFSALESMVAYVKAAGTDAEFAYSQLCAAELSTAFSSVATSMTATRLEMNRITSSETRKKDVMLRGRHVPQDERQYKSYSNEVSRWRYDHEEFKASRKSVPWDKIPFKNDDAASFIMEDKPFGKGAERLAYMFQETDIAGRQLGKLMVAKESASVDSEDRKLEFHKHFCRVQRKSSKLAELFNKDVKQRPKLRPVDDRMKAPHLSFVRCFVYTYKADDGEECGLLVEPYLKGKFTKYNGNKGFLRPKTSGPKVDLAIGEVHLTDFLQAFSHWTYCHTNLELLVCDLQGVLNEEGRFPQFELTDPCICSKHGNIRYGKTDIRNQGFRSFRRTHECNLVCKGLGLPIFGRRR
jgi:Alpha-kinase family